MNGKTKQIVTAALFAALACVATMVIKIPSPMDGYLNLGDCVGLADLFSGYAAYAPATFVIKGFMALIAFYGFKALSAKTGSLTARILSGAAAELWMVLGYYLFEGCLYGFVPSAVNIPANGVQGAAGLILGVLLVKALEKSRVIKQA